MAYKGLFGEFIFLCQFLQQILLSSLRLDSLSAHFTNSAFTISMKWSIKFSIVDLDSAILKLQRARKKSGLNIEYI
jgi:hypothetical protein